VRIHFEYCLIDNENILVFFLDESLSPVPIITSIIIHLILARFILYLNLNT